MATMKVYQQEPVVEKLHKMGSRLKDGLNQVISARGLSEQVKVIGKPCCMILACNDGDGNPSQEFRTLMLQETIKRGLIIPSLVVSYSHSEEDIDLSIEAVDQSLNIYSRALSEGVENHLVGPPSRIVYRKFN